MEQIGTFIDFHDGKLYNDIVFQLEINILIKISRFLLLQIMIEAIYFMLGLEN